MDALMLFTQALVVSAIVGSDTGRKSYFSFTRSREGTSTAMYAGVGRKPTYRTQLVISAIRTP